MSHKGFYVWRGGSGGVFRRAVRIFRGGRKQWKIRINVVAPGVNNAGMAEQSVRSGKYDPFVEKKIIPRFGRPEDVVRAVLFFLEPDSYVTGQVLTVDGGLSLKM